MKPRNGNELIPIIAVLVSATLYFEAPAGITELLLLAIIISILGVWYGYHYTNRHGQSLVIFAGVACSIILLLVEIPIIIFGYFWSA